MFSAMLGVGITFSCVPLTNAVALVRPLFMDQWPTDWLRPLAVYAVVGFWVALALTRKRFRI